MDATVMGAVGLILGCVVLALVCWNVYLVKRLINAQIKRAMLVVSLRTLRQVGRSTTEAAIATAVGRSLDQFLEDLQWKQGPNYLVRDEGVFKKKYYLVFEAQLYLRHLPLTPLIRHEVFLGQRYDKEQIERAIKAALTIAAYATGNAQIPFAA